MKHLQYSAVLSLLALFQLGAQTPATSAGAAAKTGKAKIVGVVVDSIDNRYLDGADVLVDGTNIATRTDSLGKFTIEDLPPGTYRVGVFHPVLDSLGLTIVTAPFRVGPDSVSFAVLAVPSPETMVGRICPPAANPGAASAIIGTVEDPETGKPIPQTDVSVSWAEIEVSKTVGIRRTPRLMRATSDSTGHFQLCGLPSGLDATIQARHGTSSTPELPVSLGGRPVELAVRTILLPLDSSVKTGNATLSGTVALEKSDSNAGTRVELVGNDAVALTDPQGRFTMQGVPAGSRLLVARHLGYVVGSTPVDLTPRETTHVALTLPRFVATMDPVLVTARRTAALDKVGFNQRARSGTGYFVGPDRLRNMHPLYMTDILRMVPSLRVVYTPNGATVMSSRGVTSLSGGSGCVQYFVDDMPFTETQPGEANGFISGSEIVAVEVYQPGLAPAQYSQGTGSCTTILLWTRFKVRG
jgi:Carboxypeptidase regulatory-like domain